MLLQRATKLFRAQIIVGIQIRQLRHRKPRPYPVHCLPLASCSSPRKTLYKTTSLSALEVMKTAEMVKMAGKDVTCFVIRSSWPTCGGYYSELFTCIPPGLSENQLNDCLPWGEGLGFSEETTLGSKNLGMELDGVRKLKPRRAWVGGSAKIFPQCFERHQGLCSSANNFLILLFIPL